MGLFFLSWVNQVHAGETWDTIYLVANHHVFSTGTDPSGKILAGIQQPVAIFPWFHGQKYEGTKLFSFSTKASYHRDCAHRYSNSSVVKTFEAYKKPFQTNQKTDAQSCHHWLPVPVHSFCHFPSHSALKSREQRAGWSPSWQSFAAHPVPPQPQSSTGAVGFLSDPWHQCSAHSKSWLLPQAPALTKKESKEHITLLFHREPRLAQFIISRWNVCNQQLHPSSQGAVIFASLTLLPLFTNTRVFYLKACFPGDQKYILQFSNLPSLSSQFPYTGKKWPNVSESIYKSHQALILLSSNHNTSYIESLSLKEWNKLYFACQHTEPYVGYCKLLKAQRYSLCVLLLEYGIWTSKQQLSETALSLPPLLTMGWASPSHYQVKRIRIRQTIIKSNCYQR